jgi:hypothetical protein
MKEHAVRTIKRDNVRIEFSRRIIAERCDGERHRSHVLLTYAVRVNICCSSAGNNAAQGTLDKLAASNNRPPPCVMQSNSYSAETILLTAHSFQKKN